MREILFRGKRIDNGEWVYGLFARCKVGNLILPCIQRERENDSGDYIEAIIVNGNTLGQYTGIKDKNGKGIYEGDIIKCQGGEYYYGIWEYRSEIIISNLTQIGFELGEYEHIEIIGNIHDKEEE